MLEQKVAEGLNTIWLEKVNNWLKELSWRSELALVLLLGFGLFIYNSTRGLFIIASNSQQSLWFNLTSKGNYATVVYELIAFFLIAYILKIRGWTLKDFNLQLTVRLFYVAFLLMVLRNLIGGFSFKFFELIQVTDEKTIQQVQFSLKADWVSLALIVVINSVFEEFLLVGYLFKRLEAYHPFLIIGCGILIRMLFHSYQGTMMLFSIIPMGLVFGYYYYRYRKIWPLVIAHGMINILVFVNLYFQSLHR
ncbi:MAG TPA: type II CAAX endopeptidase family protein [Prolixibacteraceae bacterium]|nr:type II CAAX endopeptidase family protein [Prolixibacteraceae bacterium]